MGTYIRSTSITDQSEFIENLQNGKQIGKLLDMPKRPQAPKPIWFFFVVGGGVNYNSRNLTFEIASNKGLDSEDADRRDSMNRLFFSSFCRADEKLYNKPIFPFQLARPRKVFQPEKC